MSSTPSNKSPQPRRGAIALPPAVLPGDLIGVAALSGRVDPQRLEVGIEALEAMGYRVRRAANLDKTCGYFAGSDAERLDGFHELAADPDVAAIVFARGGHGVLRLIPDLDWSLLAQRPRAYMGYSDLTPFLLQVVQRLNLVAFHGPMVAADFARGLHDAERKSFQAALEGRWPQDRPLAWTSSSEERQGRLMGGCLSMLEAVLGTDYAVDFQDAILFVEDLNEPPYRFDRMLTHLRLSGNLTGLNAFIVGHLVGDGQRVTGGPSEGEDGASKPLHPSEHPDAMRLREVLVDLVSHFDWPWAWGLDAGHAPPNLVLPLGMWARLDPVNMTLWLEPR